MHTVAEESQICNIRLDIQGNDETRRVVNFGQYVIVLLEIIANYPLQQVNEAIRHDNEL